MPTATAPDYVIGMKPLCKILYNRTLPQETTSDLSIAGWGSGERLSKCTIYSFFSQITKQKFEQSHNNEGEIVSALEIISLRHLISLPGTAVLFLQAWIETLSELAVKESGYGFTPRESFSFTRRIYNGVDYPSSLPDKYSWEQSAEGSTEGRGEISAQTWGKSS